MLARWRVLIGLGSLLYTSANAGTLSCTTNGNFLLGANSKIAFAFGRCNLSASYGATGDVFPGTGTASENASQSLCGDTTATVKTTVFTPILSTTIGAALGGVTFQYDYDNFSIRAYLPTNITSIVSNMTAAVTAADFNFLVNFVGTNAVLTGTNSAPLITAINDATGTPLTVKTGALAVAGGASSVVGVSAPVLTMDTYNPAGTVAIASPLAVTLAVGGGNQPGAEIPAASDVHTAAINFFAVCIKS